MHAVSTPQKPFDDFGSRLPVKGMAFCDRTIMAELLVASMPSNGMFIDSPCVLNKDQRASARVLQDRHHIASKHQSQGGEMTHHLQ